jgi:hypothetical protein
MTDEELKNATYKDFNFCEEEQAYVLSYYDSSDETYAWSETTVYYSLTDDLTYSIRVNQDGGEEMINEEQGFII